MTEKRDHSSRNHSKFLTNQRISFRQGRRFFRIWGIFCLGFLIGCEPDFSEESFSAGLDDDTLYQNGGDSAYIAPSQEDYDEHEPIVIYFGNLPGGAKDWVGLYAADAAHDEYLDYIYADKQRSGTMTFGSLPKGAYDARLFFDDSYKLEYEVSFTVGGGP